MDFSGTVAVVTGGASGIGRATCLRLAREGLRVVVLDKDPAGGLETVRAIEEKGGTASFYPVDVSAAEQVKTAVGLIEKEIGRVNYLVNAAGRSGPYGSVTEASEEQWDLVINTNLRGVFLVSKCVIPLIRAAGGGAVTNVASIYAFGTTPGIAAYPVSKSGVVSLTQSMAIDYAKDGIRVNAVSPGSVRTKILEEHAAAVAQKSGRTVDAVVAEWGEEVPLRRVADPMEIASVIAFTLSDDASYLTGANIVVDGGLRCLV